MSVILALGRLRQEDSVFEAALGYMAVPHFQKKIKLKCWIAWN